MPSGGADAGRPGDGLYDLVPEEFVAARNELAKRLRQEGAREEATAVAQLRRPSPTAWALNQVARHDPAAIRRVLAAGAALRAAMEAAVAGDASGLRATQAADREAVAAVVEDAATRLDPGNDALARRMVATLRAAVLDDALADRLRRGLLVQDEDAPGFGLEGLTVSPAPPATRPARPATPRPAPPATPKPAPPATPKPAPPTTPEPAPPTTPKPPSRKALEADAARLRRQADLLAKAAADAEHRAADAERQAALARARADEARIQAEGAHARATQARAVATSARTDAEEAQTQAATTQTRL